jgi:hypothetical protein
MAASTPTTSTQYDNEVSGGAVKTDNNDHGVIHFYKCSWTCTGAGDATAYPIGKLPGGKLTVLPLLSTFYSDDAGAGADLDFGYGAFTNEDGTAVTADPNGWADSIDIGGGAVSNTWYSNSTLTRPTEYNSKEGIPVTISTDTADVDVGDVIEICVAYVKHG